MDDPVLGGSKSLEVNVIDALTGKPLSGAVIYLRLPWTEDTHGHAGDFVYPGTTDEQGRLLITGLHARRYWIDVIAWGYVRHSATWMARFGRRPDDVRMGPGHSWFEDAHWHNSLEGDPEAAELLADLSGVSVKEIRLERGRLIIGRVQDAEGRPRVGARVEVVDEFTPWRVPSYPVVNTRADGSFGVTVHPEAEYKIRFYGPGVLLETLSRKPMDDEAPLVVTLHPSSTLRGRVLDPDGEPVEDAVVLAVSPKLEGRTYRTSTRRAGHFDFGAVEPGPLILVALREGRGSVLRREENPPADVELRLSPFRRVRGTLRNPDGTPAADTFLMQSFRAQVGRLWVDFAGGHSHESSEKNQAGLFLSCVLNVGVYFTLPVTRTDTEGRFTLDVASPDGRTVLHAWRDKGEDRGRRDFFALVSADRPADLIFTDTGDAARYLDILDVPPESLEEALSRVPEGFNRGEAAITERVLADADRRWPDAPEVLRRLARARSALGNHEGARTVADRLVNQLPRDADTWLARAWNRFRLKDYPAAEAAYTEALVLTSNRLWILATRALFRARTGNLDGARADRAEALARNQGKDPIISIMLATVEAWVGDSQAALREIESYVNAPYFGHLAWGARAEARQAAGDLKGALEDVERLLADLPDSEDLRKEHEERRDELRRRLSSSG